MFFHPFSTARQLHNTHRVAMWRERYGLSPSFSLVKALPRQAAQLIIGCMMAGAGLVASSVEASSEGGTHSGRARFEEEETRRGQRGALRVSPTDIAAWQRGDEDWLSASASDEGSASDWESMGASTSSYTGSSGPELQSLESYMLSDSASIYSMNTDIPSRASSSSGRSVASDSSDALLHIQFPAILSQQAESSPQNDTAVSRASSSHSAIASEAEAVSQHTGGMDLQMPVIEESGAVSGGGSPAAPTANQTVPQPVHLASAGTDSGKPASKSPSANAANIAPSKPAQVVIKAPHPLSVRPMRLRGGALPSSSKVLSTAEQKPMLDQQTLRFNEHLERERSITYAGIAAAMALPNLPPSQPGKTTIAVGTARFKGESAVGLGLTHRSLGGAVQFNVAVSRTSTADVGARAQIGYEF